MFNSIGNLIGSVVKVGEAVVDISVETVGICADLTEKGVEGIKEFRQELNEPESTDQAPKDKPTEDKLDTDIKFTK